MTEPASCVGMDLQAPRVGLAALLDLKSLLNDMGNTGQSSDPQPRPEDHNDLSQAAPPLEVASDELDLRTGYRPVDVASGPASRHRSLDDTDAGSGGLEGGAGR